MPPLAAQQLVQRLERSVDFARLRLGDRAPSDQVDVVGALPFAEGAHGVGQARHGTMVSAGVAGLLGGYQEVTDHARIAFGRRLQDRRPDQVVDEFGGVSADVVAVVGLEDLGRPPVNAGLHPFGSRCQQSAAVPRD